MDNINNEQGELELNLDDEKIMELDLLITEGVNAKIPFSFIYPNTDKKVGVQIRPLSTTEFQTAILKSKKNKTNFLTELLKIGLYHLNGEPYSSEIIDKLPAGVVTRICNEISRISGVDLVEQTEINQSVIEEFMGF